MNDSKITSQLEKFNVENERNVVFPRKADFTLIAIKGIAHNVL